MAKILLVEDDETLAASIQRSLSSEKHSTDVVHDGLAALEYLEAFVYDLVILDWQLPQIEGVEVCQRYRRKGGQASVLMLTGKQSLDSKEEGFDAGADDYLTKPFETREFLARVRALLRRTGTYTGDVLTAGNVTLDVRNRRVTVSGQKTILRGREADMLELFLRHPNQVLSAETLLARIWDAESEASLDAVYTCMNRLRKKINPADKEALIKTVHGSGYMLEP